MSQYYDPSHGQHDEGSTGTEGRMDPALAFENTGGHKLTPIEIGIISGTVVAFVIGMIIVFVYRQRAAARRRLASADSNANGGNAELGKEESTESSRPQVTTTNMPDKSASASKTSLASWAADVLPGRKQKKEPKEDTDVRGHELASL